MNYWNWSFSKMVKENNKRYNQEEDSFYLLKIWKTGTILELITFENKIYWTPNSELVILCFINFLFKSFFYTTYRPRREQYTADSDKKVLVALFHLSIWKIFCVENNNSSYNLKSKLGALFNIFNQRNSEPTGVRTEISRYLALWEMITLEHWLVWFNII